MSNKNNLVIDTRGRPVNERVQHATVFTDISEQDRQDAADRLAELIDESHNELFGGDDE